MTRWANRRKLRPRRALIVVPATAIIRTIIVITIAAIAIYRSGVLILIFPVKR